MIANVVTNWLSVNESLIQTGLVYTILAFSVYIAMRAGVFSLAGVAFFGIGAYAAGRLAIDGHSIAVALGAAVAIATVFGAPLALILSRLRSLYLGMATFALVLLVQVGALQWESMTGGALGLLGVPLLTTSTGLVLAVVLAGMAIIAYERGRTGRMLEALRLDDQLAASMGIAVVRQRAIAFTFSCMLGGLAGGLHATLFNVVTPDQASFTLIVDALTMIVIGGTAAWYGPVIGAFVVTWLPEILRFTGDWRAIFQGLIVVVMVVYAPQGAVGFVRWIAKTLWSKRRSDGRGGGDAALPLANAGPGAEGAGR